MEVAQILTLAFCLVAAAYGMPCEDIDTQACHLMAAQNPQLCNQGSIAETACPKFCNLCGLECYHCDQAFSDYRNCTTTQQCDIGEKCFLREFHSSTDGHVEYVMACASLRVCDGMDSLMIGRRDVESRDLSLTCCSTSRCNYPGSATTMPTTAMPTTTTTSTTMSTTTTTKATTTATLSCLRDVEIVMEDPSHRALPESLKIIDFLKAVIGKLTIGPQSTLVGVTTFDTGVNDQFDLIAHPEKMSLLNALNLVHFDRNSENIDYNDVSHFLERHFSHERGNRADAPDVVLIITDTIRHQDVHPIRGFHLKSANFLVVNVNVVTAFNTLVTNPSHIVDTTIYSLMNEVDKIVSLICS